MLLGDGCPGSRTTVVLSEATWLELPLIYVASRSIVGISLTLLVMWCRSLAKAKPAKSYM